MTESNAIRIDPPDPNDDGFWSDEDKNFLSDLAENEFDPWFWDQKQFTVLLTYQGKENTGFPLTLSELENFLSSGWKLHVYPTAVEDEERRF